MVIIMGFASSLLKEIFFGRKINSKKYNKVESTTITYVCRDELDKKKSKIKKQVKFDLEPKCQQQEEESTLLELNKKSGTSLEKYKINGGGDSDDHHANSGGVRVKILIRKEDAARLLLKCREGGVLEFRDVAQELVRIPSSCVRVISSPNCNIHESHDCSLKTIPEEY